MPCVFLAVCLPRYHLQTGLARRELLLFTTHPGTQFLTVQLPPPTLSQALASGRTLRMSAVKRRRHSLNSKYDRLLKPSHSPATDSHSSVLTPSLIPDKAQVQASGSRVRRDRQRNRQRLWDDLGFGPEAEPSEPVLTESTLVCKMVSHVTPHHPC